MSNLDAVRDKLATFDAEADPDAFWELLTQEAVDRVAASFALVVLQDEDEEFVVYPGPDLEPDDLHEDLEDSPIFAAAIEAVGSDAAALAGDQEAPDAIEEPIYALAVPIRVQGDVAGALAVERYEPGPFDQQAVAALETLTDAFGPYLAEFFE